VSGAVVRLPTAAKRQPPRATTRAQRAAKALLPQFPRDRMMEPWKRLALRNAIDLQATERTPAMMLALAMWSALDEGDTKDRAEMFLLRTAASGCEGAALAHNLARTLAAPMTIGNASNLKWALDYLNGEASK